MPLHQRDSATRASSSSAATTAAAADAGPNKMLVRVRRSQAVLGCGQLVINDASVENVRDVLRRMHIQHLGEDSLRAQNR
jgi:hypothetical protein